MEVTFPERYHKAVEYIEKTYGDLEATNQLDNMQKLVFYALRKQADVGPCVEAAPSMWYVKERYKHDAWKQLKTMSKFEAMVHYVQHLDEIKSGWIHEVLSTVNAPSDEVPSDGLDVEALREPTTQNIEALISEVFRLRQLLQDHNIIFAQNSSAAPCSTRDIASSSNIGRESSTAFSADGDPAAPSSSSEVVVPVKPLPQSYSNNVIPPTKPMSGALAAKPAAAHTPTDVYYTPRRLTWMEWLGLVSVDEVAPKE
jgi:acyl-CoA-binding protein